MLLLSQPLVQLRQNVLCIADDTRRHRYIFIHFRRVDVNLNDLCVARKSGRIADDPVGKTSAHNDQKVALAHTKI